MLEASFFISNRRRLIERLEGGVIVLGAYGRQQRSNDAAHSFTQEANFWYLCGIDEPDWMLIIDGSANKSYLVAPTIEDTHATFDGSVSADEAKSTSGVDKIIDVDESISLLRSLSRRHPAVSTVGAPSYAEHFNFTLNPSIAKLRTLLERHFTQVIDVKKDIAALRAIKSQEEIVMITKSVDVTVKAFKSIHADMKTFKHEYEIEADFSHAMRRAGAAGHAYDPIIAAGINACTLHYSHNRSSISNRQLVLMDVGASYGGYAADITRTYAKGDATQRQRQVHAAVETAHKRIDLIEPMLSVESYQREVDVIMKEALTSIGLDATDDGLRRYFPHAVSHGLGIDVHDSLAAPKYFLENMVLTVEPGIYIPEEKIGVRIEDDILVTDGGNRNLSAGLSTRL